MANASWPQQEHGSPVFRKLMSVLVPHTPAIRRGEGVDGPGRAHVDVHEYTDLQGAAASFVHAVTSRSWGAVRLQCTVPTWSASSNICTDLHDLHELRDRALVFVHDLCTRLDSAGIQASYRLVPSHTSLVLLRAQPEDSISIREEYLSLEQAIPGGKEKAFLTSLDGIPSIILT